MLSYYAYYGVKLFSHIVNFFRLRVWKDAVVSLWEPTTQSWPLSSRCSRRSSTGESRKWMLPTRLCSNSRSLNKNNYAPSSGGAADRTTRQRQNHPLPEAAWNAPWGCPVETHLLWRAAQSQQHWEVERCERRYYTRSGAHYCEFCNLICAWNFQMTLSVLLIISGWNQRNAGYFDRW